MARGSTGFNILNNGMLVEKKNLVISGIVQEGRFLKTGSISEAVF